MGRLLSGRELRGLLALVVEVDDPPATFLNGVAAGLCDTEPDGFGEERAAGRLPLPVRASRSTGRDSGFAWLSFANGSVRVLAGVSRRSSSALRLEVATSMRESALGVFVGFSPVIDASRSEI